MVYELLLYWCDVVFEVFFVVNDEETNVKFIDDDGLVRKRYRKECYYGERV